MKILSFPRLALLLLPAALSAPGWALPDLAPEILSVEVTENDSVDADDVTEGCAGATTGRRLVHFGLRTVNEGADDLVMGDPECPNCATNPGVTCGNPLYVCSTAHGHAHFEEYALAELVDGSGQVVAEGVKQGFCLLDSQCANPTYHCGFQGISSGCADVYGAGLPCQYIDITDLSLPGGSYTLRVTVDFADRIEEEDETNNAAEAPVVLSGGPLPSCGDGVLDPGEACDDGNTVTGDGCRSDCVLELCGDGVVDEGEACDDGNTVDGDCCASDCAVAAPDGTVCSDPSTCREPGACSAGVCAGEPTCDPCLQCRPPDGCVLPPSALCETLPPKKSKLSLRNRFNRPERDTLSWSWTSGAPVDLDEFGAPAQTTDLHMCIYDDVGLVLSSTAPAAGTCRDKSCWKEGRKKLVYTDKDATPDGLRKLSLKPGDTGKAKIKISGKGEDLGIGELDLEGEVLVRLKRSDGTPCWQARYPESKRSDGNRYEARSRD